MDADTALKCLKEFDKTACVVVKHSSPCGVAEGEKMLEVYKKAFNADSLSAFGGVIAINKKCTKEIANEINKVFIEIVLAPCFDPSALKVFSTKKNLRILEVGNINSRADKMELRNLDGGLLVQGVDTSTLTIDDLKEINVGDYVEFHKGILYYVKKITLQDTIGIIEDDGTSRSTRVRRLNI